MRSTSARDLHSRAKQAAGVLRTPAEASQARADALRQLLQIGAIGLGTGLAGRSLVELPRWFAGRKPLVPAVNSSARPQVQLHGLNEEEDLQKVAGSVFQTAADTLMPTPSTTRPLGDVWGPAAALGTASLGLAGGWKLTDWLLDKQRKAEQESEFDAAKQEWQQAMADEYRAAMMAKQAGDDLGVDGLFDALEAREKTAGLADMAQAPWSGVVGHDNWQMAKGLALATMLATGVGAGYATFNANNKNSRRKILEKALRERARKRQTASPPPIMVQAPTVSAPMPSPLAAA